MKSGRKKIGVLLAFAVLFATFAFLTVGCATAATHYVISGESIQAVVDNASAGDTIVVYNGTYTENVEVGKMLTLLGEGADVVTVQAAYNRKPIFKVTADRVNISGFTVTGATSSNVAGIYINRADHCDVSENNAHGNCEGIRLSGSSNNTLKDNTLNSNDHFGFFLLGSSSSNTVANNIANSNDYGIYVSYSSSNTLTNNTANTNRDYGIYLYDSDNNTLENNIANSNEYCGIYLYSYEYKYPATKYNTLTGNIANSNDCGIRLSASSNNTLVNNTANSNEDGIHISYKSSMYNTIHHNNFADNTRFDAHDTYNFANTWDNGTEGNYYSDYTGTDLDGDGIGDTSYLIPGSDGSVDNYPLMQPWKGYRVHNPDTGEDFLGIQAAIDDSDTDDGHTIIVDAGVYKMNVNVNKRLTLQGAGADAVTVIAAQSDDHVFDVTANYVNISGFTVTGAGSGKGIYLNGTDHCSISNNTASNNEYGIYLNSSMCTTLVNNTISGNVYNFVLRGGSLSEYIHNIDTSNTVDEKPIYYWVDQRDKIIPGDAGYVGVVDCTNITVRDLTLTKNGEGVLFAYTERSMIENIIVSANKYGIYLSCSSSNTLQDNTASSNEVYGIDLNLSNDNMLTSNTANSNKYGIELFYSSSNTLQDNTASSNEVYGINLNLSNDNMLASNDANTNSEDGIYMVDSDSNMLQDNTANSNSQQGINLHESSDNILQSNIASSNICGMLLTSSSDNTLASNTASSNEVYGFYLNHSGGNTLASNIASSNNCGVLLTSSSDNTLAKNNASLNKDHGIYMDLSDNNKLVENTANRNNGDVGYHGHSNCDWNHWFAGDGGNGYGYGIRLSSSSNNTLIRNTANLNGGSGGGGGGGGWCRYGGDGGNGYGYGIRLSSSSNNTLTGNTANLNFGLGGTGGSGGYSNGNAGYGYGYGIYLRSSSNNTLTNNTASNDGYGIFLYSSSNNNTIYNNYFNNSNNAWDNGNNIWNITPTFGENIIGGPFIGGNYWSDYIGIDNNGKGFGDTAYSITGGTNKDYLPLVHVQGICGDIDGNGIVNIMDVRLLANHVNDPTGYPVEPWAGDVEGEGDIDDEDVQLLLAHVFAPEAHPLNCRGD